jgi:hypothetical protein
MIRIISSDNDIRIMSAKSAAVAVQFRPAMALERCERLAEALQKNMMEWVTGK